MGKMKGHLPTIYGSYKQKLFSLKTICHNKVYEECLLVGFQSQRDTNRKNHSENENYKYQYQKHIVTVTVYTTFEGDLSLLYCLV